MEDMAVMDTQKNKQLFEETPVLKAVVALEVPTVISQLITVVYNMADTYFVGRTGDPDQVAAASICLPLFMLLTGMAKLFGIGGASLISRSLGKGDNDCAKRSSVFSIWTGAVCQGTCSRNACSGSSSSRKENRLLTDIKDREDAAKILTAYSLKCQEASYTDASVLYKDVLRNIMLNTDTLQYTLDYDNLCRFRLLILLHIRDPFHVTFFRNPRYNGCSRY